jgi:hypothetical protein
MSQLSSVSHLRDYVHNPEIAITNARGLRKLARGVAQYLGLLPYPEKVMKRREKTAAEKALKKPEFVDWNVAEWSINRVDPKNFSW